MDYRQYIQSPEWKVRSRLYRNAHPRCEICGCDDKFELRCHHISYDNLGDEPDEDLMTLCQSCHQGVEFIKNYRDDVPTLYYASAIISLGFYDEDSNGLLKSLGCFQGILPKIGKKFFSLYVPNPNNPYEYYQRLSGKCSTLIADKNIKQSEFPVHIPSFYDTSVIACSYFIKSYVLDTLNGYNKLDRIGDLINDIDFAIDNYKSVFLYLCILSAFCLEIDFCYKGKYPHIAHNARCIAKRLIPQIANFFDKSNNLECPWEVIGIFQQPIDRGDETDDLPF